VLSAVLFLAGAFPATIGLLLVLLVAYVIYISVVRYKVSKLFWQLRGELISFFVQNPIPGFEAYSGGFYVILESKNAVPNQSEITDRIVTFGVNPDDPTTTHRSALLQNYLEDSRLSS
jgi:hypothetical protein